MPQYFSLHGILTKLALVIIYTTRMQRPLTRVNMSDKSTLDKRHRLTLITGVKQHHSVLYVTMSSTVNKSRNMSPAYAINMYVGK